MPAQGSLYPDQLMQLDQLSFSQYRTIGFTADCRILKYANESAIFSLEQGRYHAPF